MQTRRDRRAAEYEPSRYDGHALARRCYGPAENYAADGVPDGLATSRRGPAHDHTSYWRHRDLTYNSC